MNSVFYHHNIFSWLSFFISLLFIIIPGWCILNMLTMTNFGEWMREIKMIQLLRFSVMMMMILMIMMMMETYLHKRKREKRRAKKILLIHSWECTGTVGNGRTEKIKMLRQASSVFCLAFFWISLEISTIKHCYSSFTLSLSLSRSSRVFFLILFRFLGDGEELTIEEEEEKEEQEEEEKKMLFRVNHIYIPRTHMRMDVLLCDYYPRWLTRVI